MNTPEDAYLVSLAYPVVKAKMELEGHFKPKMDEDRAYKLGMIATQGNEEAARNYVYALASAKADRYGSKNSGHS